jgi:hypothetical protein
MPTPRPGWPLWQVSYRKSAIPYVFQCSVTKKKDAMRNKLFQIGNGRSQSILVLCVRVYVVKKVNGFPFPSRDVTYQTLPGRELFIQAGPASDIPAGDGETANLFLQCTFDIFFVNNYSMFVGKLL